MEALDSCTKFSLKNKLSIIVIPPISYSKYLRFLYKSMLKKSNPSLNNFDLYSPHMKFPTLKSRFLYLIEIFLLIFRKTCSNKQIILHIHWIEFLYLWGRHKYLIPLLTPLVLFLFRIFKMFSRNKVAITVHNILPHKISWRYFEYNFFRFMLKKMSDCIFVHSTLYKTLLTKFYKVDPQKIFVIQHGLFKTPKIRNSIQNKKIRIKLGISQNDIVFSLIGLISEYKGISVLLDALKHLFDNLAMF